MQRLFNTSTDLEYTQVIQKSYSEKVHLPSSKIYDKSTVKVGTCYFDRHVFLKLSNIYELAL